ncbi:hypothetical protein MWU49_14530 [Alcanivorax sp. S6407]|uniref:hypothetical protein n=1 Tax=Alcanivorax sp. S6407 TaxID=2926424 RepID=UPI001FF5F262|nr:hypothetical protein [Alcanivorax sp. S6407]MCK0154929.1 hypothetical protein [Alcanivorax sp. S6407]
MKIFKVGDTQKAICSHCQSLQTATYQLRDVPFSDGSGIVKNVLVGVCNQCDQVALLPHQSTPAVRRELDTARKPVESRIPAHMLDILSLASYELGGSTDFIPTLMKYYIHRLAADQNAAGKITSLLGSDLAKGKADKRLSLKGRKISEEVELLKVRAHISNTTDLIKGVILKINDDILVKKRAQPTNALKSFVASIG